MKRFLLFAMVATLLRTVHAFAIDGGELHRWGDGAQGWWLSPGSFNTKKANDPLTGANGSVSNTATLAYTNGVYAMRFDGSSTYIDIPSQPRFNLSAVSDPTTFLCNAGSAGLGLQGLCGVGDMFHWANSSGIIQVFNSSGVSQTNYTITPTHPNDGAWWSGSNVIVWCRGNTSGTNGTLYGYSTNGVASGTWDIGAGSSLTNITSVAHLASNQFVVTQYDYLATKQRLGLVYLGAAGAYSVAWSSNLPAYVGMYGQGSAGTNGHAYVLFDLNAQDEKDTAAIYDFAISSTGYAFNGIMLCGVPAQTENDGLTWWNGTLVIGNNNASGTGVVRQTSWPMMVKHGFTLSAWATKESSSGNLELISKFNGVTGGRSWIMSNLSGQLGCYLRGTNEQYIFQGVSGGTNFPLYTWHNFTLTFDGFNLVGYTDGSVALSNPTMVSGSTAIALPSPTDVLIGSIVGSQYWQGFMRDVRMWNRPLSAAEIQRLYLEGP